MLEKEENRNLLETKSLYLEEIQEDIASLETVLLTNPPLKLSKPETRSTLRALTLEGVFGTLFYSIIGGALLSNFLLDLGAGPVEIGMLASIPQLVNLLQPFGAYLADQMQSRYRYSLSIFGPSRLLWLILVLAIGLAGSFHIPGHQLVQLTLAIIWVTQLLESFGRASWLSWMAALVPQRVRGRYFGFRNSAVSLTNLIGVPLLALVVSNWPGGRLQGYGAILALGIGLGVTSLVCQFFMTDVNPKRVHATHSDLGERSSLKTIFSFLEDANFLKFLLYSGLWSFAVNVCAPFFNLYLLDDLSIDVSVVTLYNSIGAGANLLMLVFWGKLADRVGNRPIMLVVGILVALTPLLWLEAGTAPIFLWVWFPLLHIIGGGTWAAIDLCSNNLLMGVAPLLHQSIYFAIAAAVPGVTGAIGITTGGFLATLTNFGGLPGVFALSAILRLVALLFLVFVHEQRSVSLGKFWLLLLPAWWRRVPIEPGDIRFQPLIVEELDSPPESSCEQS
ncbi:MFS transporter [Allocoleopsis franciscana]|uniref:Major Facilitator Superfamily transporter n=1 Tax=Allocoleopsis franciscana PCC 7113 TaxID=1173027 RepID=K9WH75_9CYAN|nr:MFS transporter [Allocoleopsis franciscana]AFZ19146.1 Major Facilitator Superfamily transporter [Allocoleopsis franciscana PCC 7113]